MESGQEKYKEKLFDIAFQATRDKFAILPILSGLILALLALGSAGDLFSNTVTVKYLATILLLLMILSIQVYYSETVELNSTATDQFYKSIGIDKETRIDSLTESIWYLLSGRLRGHKEDKDFFKRFSSQFPAYAILLLWFVVFMMIWLIWKGSV